VGSHDDRIVVDLTEDPRCSDGRVVILAVLFAFASELQPQLLRRFGLAPVTCHRIVGVGGVRRKAGFQLLVGKRNIGDGRFVHMTCAAKVCSK
jgi:hypothetical protein